MRDDRLSVGVWCYGMGSDRYVEKGYKDYIDFEKKIELISNLKGVKGVEVTFPQDLNEKNFDNIVELLESRNLEISAIGVELVCDAEWKTGSFTSYDPERRKKSIELTTRAMDVAYKLGAKTVNLWLGQDGFDYVFQNDYSDAWINLLESLKKCADHNPDINLGLEYKVSEPRMSCMVNSGGKALAAAVLTGRKNVGVTLDVGHAFNAGENPAEIASVLMAEKRLFHIHLNDNYRIADDDMPLGTVHWPQYLELFYWLERLGYNGWLSLDLYPYRDDPSAACEVSLNFISKIKSLAKEFVKNSDFENIKGLPPSAIINQLINRVFY
ncbi:MAG: xylose isomerase [Tepidanaerobacteraceae bacterium]|nr:xylose isomerase [Tepidanaerobacteraceae bacterium]